MLHSFNKLNKELLKNFRIIIAMGKADFKNEYAGSALGLIWGMLKPFTMVLAYWFVFSVGFKSQPVNDNVPYVAWLIPGLFAWTFLSDSLTSASAAIRNNAHLVKKVVFPVSVLPAIRIFMNCLNHLIFMVIALILLLLLKVPFNIYAIQIVYFIFAGIIFTLAITRLLSAMSVMSIDILHFINTFMQLLFWGTPVVWAPTQIANVSPLLLKVLKLNPYFYLVQGYRDSFFSGRWFFQDWHYMLYFWGLTLVIFLIGSYYFEKTRKEFSDVL